MNPIQIREGSGICHVRTGPVQGTTVLRHGQPYVRIRNVDRMSPFFMSIVSDSDHWLFVGSNSPFTAGRTDPDRALFPYQTVDKILRHPDSSGAMTIFLVNDADGWARWEPWRSSGDAYRIERNLYKHTHGTAVIFEEINHDLSLRFEFGLTAAEPYGFVRSCRLENLGDDPTTVRYLDGWHTLIAPGFTQDHFASLSILATAYLRHEQDPETGLGVFALNAGISDRTEPCESLRATCAWSLGHADPVILLCERQVEAFRRGEPVHAETEVRGEFGAHLVVADAEIESRKTHAWTTVADTHLDHAAAIAIRRQLRDPVALQRAVDAAVVENRAGLRRRIAAADGLQETAAGETCVHHFANAMFNCMRGGTFPEGYLLPGADFSRHLERRNRKLHAGCRRWLEDLPPSLPLASLIEQADALDNAQLSRLAREYMPLTFSRRHGDPSRPWNRFAIHIKDEHDQPIYAYEGNWRDIFQNWESLAWSYPGYLESMITIFLNATTPDGYNPYRISHEGIDWEIENPDDPWSHIGYWGDHQIIYLLRLLEASERFFPGGLRNHLRERRYAYARVPYRISGFDAIAADPGHTITFDHALHDELLRAAAEVGADARLHRDSTGNVVLVTLAEKLLIPLLTKLTNFVPEGGIWLNTQRPEWNDANNALAGNGLSMVTVCYLRRYLAFCGNLFSHAGNEPIELSASVAELLDRVTRVLGSASNFHGDTQRFQVLEALGRAGEAHRDAAYLGDWSTTRTIGPTALCALVEAALPVVDATIHANRREDGLFHSYNVLRLEDGARAAVDTLYPMLEGQVAVASSGALAPAETLDILRALRTSDLYREDQHSYLLYPDRTLPSFLERNVLTPEQVAAIPLLTELAQADDRRLVVADSEGTLHFQADLTNARDVQSRLRELAGDEHGSARVTEDSPAVLALWEQIFQHRFFTGRSGTMFAFEGLGSIYWHMVAKFLLAVQETHADATGEVRNALGDAYQDVRSGLGFTKTPEVYGAFPSDPYSHSPRHRGAQQPGMTGQVKEELITRFGELGIVVANGCLQFDPALLSRDEFFTTPHPFRYVDLNGRDQCWDLPAGSLGFTYCQVPICYRLADTTAIAIERRDASDSQAAGSSLDSQDSKAIFARDGTIVRLIVDVPASCLRARNGDDGSN